MDVTDTCCKEVNAKVSDHLALCRICTFTHTYNTIFFTTDGTNFCFDGDSLCMSSFNQLFGLCNILFDRIFGTVEHNGRETSFHTLIAVIIGTMVQMNCYRNSNVLILDQSVYHTHNYVITTHVFACTFGYA